MRRQRSRLRRSLALQPAPEELVQRQQKKEADDTLAAPAFSAAVQSGGQALDSATRTQMEPHFGHDFGQVRVHTGEQAAESARTIDSQAYTVGSNIVFGAGRYAPDNRRGQQLLAHELAHVVQQAPGRATAPTSARELPLGATGDPFEQAASQAAASLMSTNAPVSGIGAGNLSGQTIVQRQEEDDDMADVGEPLTVEHDVELVAQPTDSTGWAASMAMLTSFREGEEVGVNKVTERSGLDMETPYDWEEIQKSTAVWEMRPMELEQAIPEPDTSVAGPKPPAPNEWGNLLETLGPLWITRISDPEQAVVLAKMNGDGSAENTEITVYDPTPMNSGVVETRTLQDFNEEFRLEERNDIAVVHADI
jgi:hypothetical protein